MVCIWCINDHFRAHRLVFWIPKWTSYFDGFQTIISFIYFLVWGQVKGICSNMFVSSSSFFSSVLIWFDVLKIWKDFSISLWICNILINWSRRTLLWDFAFLNNVISISISMMVCVILEVGIVFNYICLFNSEISFLSSLRIHNKIISVDRIKLLFVLCVSIS